jgi:hypothetical protein
MKNLQMLIPFYTWYLARKNGYYKSWKVAVACFQFETGNYTNRGAKELHNICGMRPASVRPQNRIGEDGGYAVFANYWDCINDYFERQKNFGVSDSGDIKTWVHELKASKYFEANENEYFKGVTYYYNNDSGDYSRVVYTVLFGGAVFVGAIGYILYLYAQKKAGIEIKRK